MGLGSLDKKSLCKNAIWAVDPGAVNLSGLAGTLLYYIDAVADETENDFVVVGTIMNIVLAARDAWKKENSSTQTVNTDANVRNCVEQLVSYCYYTDSMRQMAAHPAVRLIADQMRHLSGVRVDYDRCEISYQYLWEEAVSKCEEVINE